ncbi:MAG TPA: 3-phosphoshikimate 1-carboxyvinyltransferase [Bacillota bacterium]|nr:3-phosphoshikimate 1-carboxyvinyltransferase [Bacillota bacterium]
MQPIELKQTTNPLKGTLAIPGDKSISHRSIMLGSLAKGTTNVSNFLDGDDCMHTVEAFKNMGVHITVENTDVTIESEGAQNLRAPKVPLYFGNSGTTARLMIGLLAGLPFFSSIYGDPYLTERPMSRVTEPLKQMNASIVGRDNGNLLPLAIDGKSLTGMTYELPVKSAQVKSAVLLGGLYADSKTTVIEIDKTRDHTERMLKAFGAHVEVDGNTVQLAGNQSLVATDIQVPGDISSAAFMLTAAAIVEGSELTLTDVGLNETRTGIIDILEQMGADLTFERVRVVNEEKIGDITIKYKPLQSTTVQGEIIPRLIDEIPLIALLASQAEGKTVIKDAEELRVKETDRIDAVVDVLSTLGATIEATDDGMIIHGKSSLSGGKIKSYFDHRIAMMGVVASLIAKDTVTLDDTSSIAVSYPTFLTDLERIK